MPEDNEANSNTQNTNQDKTQQVQQNETDLGSQPERVTHDRQVVERFGKSLTDGDLRKIAED